MKNHQTTRRLKVSCPQCEQKLDVSDIPAFTVVSCIRCQCRITVPRRFSHYLLEEPIAEGRASSVYRASDLKLDRRVAVKIFSAALSGNPDAVTQLITRTKRMAILNHPNIVPIFSNGEHEGRYYIAMEYMTGHSLDRKVMEDHPLPAPLCLHYAIQTVRGLAAAHREGMMHGGLNPRNLLLDESDNLKISDFGMWNIAPNADGSRNRENNFSHLDQGYTSPEIIDTGSGTYKSDLFSLGACLYYALTGLSPLAGNWRDQTVKEDHETVLPALLAEEPLTVRPDLDEELNGYILDLLSLSPEERPGSYEQVLTRLETIRRQTGGVNKSGTGFIKSVYPDPGRFASRNRKESRPDGSVVVQRYHRLRRQRRLIQIGILLGLAGLGVTFSILLRGRQRQLPWYQERFATIEEKIRDGLLSRPRIVITEEDGIAPDDEETITADPPVEPPQTDVEPVIRDDNNRPAGNGQVNPLFHYRPRPPDLNFRSVQEELQTYLRHHSGHLRELEQERIIKLSLIHGYLRQLMRTPFDGTRTGILLASGRRIHGVIPFCNEYELTVRLASPPGAVRTIKWQDLHFEQYFAFFLYYIDRRLIMREAPQNRMLNMDPARDAAQDFFRIALLADWYGDYGRARYFAARALELKPELRPDIDNFLYYLIPEPQH